MAFQIVDSLVETLHGHSVFLEFSINHPQIKEGLTIFLSAEFQRFFKAFDGLLILYVDGGRLKGPLIIVDLLKFAFA